MIDERLYPCLLLVQTLESEQDKIKKILNIGKSVGETQESLSLFFLLKSVPGNKWRIPKEIPKENLQQDFQDFIPINCVDTLITYPEDYSKICCLCPYSQCYTNYKMDSERFVLSVLISDLRESYIKKSMVLKPGNLKSRYCFIAEKQLFILSLHQLLFQYIQNASSLQIPDNPLIDNLKLPNWERILDSFMTSPIFKRATKWQQLTGPVQGHLYSLVKDALLLLQPPASIDSHMFDYSLKEIIARKRYTPLLFGETKTSAEKNIKKRQMHAIADNPPPILDLPPTLNDEPSITLPSPISTSDGHSLSPEALSGLFSPAEHMQQANKEEVIQNLTVKPSPVSKTEAAADRILDDVLSLATNGWFDVSYLVKHHSILPLHPDMIRSYVCDAYMVGSIILDCAYCDGVPGLILYIPGHGTPSWGKLESCLFILDATLSDCEIKKMSWNWTEVAAICQQYGFQSIQGICSLSAVYCASTDNPILYPLSEMLEVCGICREKSTYKDLITLIKSYPILYEHYYMRIGNVVGHFSGIHLWTGYERALATSVDLRPQFSMNQRNLIRTGIAKNEFVFNPRYRKLMQGVCFSIRLQLEISQEQLRLEADDKLSMNVLSVLFSSTVLISYGLRLLSYKNGEFIFFTSVSGKHELAYIEEIIGKSIAKKFRAFHYSPPSLTISY